MKRRAFLRSLSRTALVLPFADILALAAPLQQGTHDASRAQSIRERSYDAKAWRLPPPGPKSLPLKAHRWALALWMLRRKPGSECEDYLWRRVYQQVFAGNDRVRVGLLRLRRRWVGGSVSCKRLAA